MQGIERQGEDSIWVQQRRLSAFLLYHQSTVVIRITGNWCLAPFTRSGSTALPDSPCQGGDQSGSRAWGADPIEFKGGQIARAPQVSIGTTRFLGLPRRYPCAGWMTGRFARSGMNPQSQAGIPRNHSKMGTVAHPSAYRTGILADRYHSLGILPNCIPVTIADPSPRK